MNQEPHYYRKSKTISLTWNFSPYQFPGLKYSDLEIKFIAPRELWLKALPSDKPKRKGLPFDTLTFADVKPFLQKISPRGNKKESVQALTELAAEDPDHFAAVFFDACVLANSFNPLFRPARKARRRVYALDTDAVRTAARQLYVYLRLLKVHKPRGWRDKLAFIEDKYGVECNDIRPAVMEIIQDEFNFLLGRPDSEGIHSPDPCQFYRKFIYSPKALAWMKKSTRIKTGMVPFLEQVLS